jgi:hypothetical protein
MNKKQLNFLIILFVSLIVFFILALFGISVSEKFEIDEGNTFLDFKHIPLKTKIIKYAIIKEREQQLRLYTLLNYFGIFISVLGILLCFKKKKSYAN